MNDRITPTNKGLSMSSPILKERNPMRHNGAIEMTMSVFEICTNSSSCGIADSKIVYSLVDKTGQSVKSERFFFDLLLSNPRRATNNQNLEIMSQY